MSYNYSTKIDIVELLDGLNDYIVIKMSDRFPNYEHYDDLDIICKDAEILAQNLLAKQAPAQIERIQISKTGTGHIHLDYYIPFHNTLNFRFDLIDSFSYDKFAVNDEYMGLVLGRKETKAVRGGEVYVPHLVDDLVLRFLEWIEYPTKEKHLRYVKENLNDEAKKEFINIISENTSLKKEQFYDIIV